MLLLSAPRLGDGYSHSAQQPLGEGMYSPCLQAFYINLVIGAVFAPAYIFLLPNVQLLAGKPLVQRLSMLDWVGTTIFIAGSVCFTMAITFSGLTYPWSSGSAIALWVMTGVLLLCTIAVTIWHPLSTKEGRLIPAHFFRRPEILNLALQTFLASGVMLSGAYYIPLFFAFTEVRQFMFPWPGACSNC